jgi:putative ABC transport system substrate-binding protein|nr:ABC transporter substrate-binding protein [Caldimonas sp.]
MQRATIAAASAFAATTVALAHYRIVPTKWRRQMTSPGPAPLLDRPSRLRRQALLGLVAALIARPAPSAEPVRRIGILGDTPGAQWDAFRDALRDLGYVEGANVATESRYSLGESSRFVDLAAELVRSKVDIIVAEGGLATAAAKKATSSIPIVMTIVGDPVGSGLVASLSNPGGNVTGSTSLAFDLTAKQLQLLKELMPSLTNVVFLWNPNESFHARAIPHVESAARALGMKVVMVEARNLNEVDEAFRRLGATRPGAVLMLPSTNLDAQQGRTAALATRERLPALYNKSLFCRSGGLICYGARYLDFFRRAAVFVDRIFKGEKPANLPVQQPTVYDLVVNLQAAKALGIAVPDSILYRADEVIR